MHVSSNTLSLIWFTVLFCRRGRFLACTPPSPTPSPTPTPTPSTLLLPWKCGTIKDPFRLQLEPDARPLELWVWWRPYYFPRLLSSLLSNALFSTPDWCLSPNEFSPVDSFALSSFTLLDSVSRWEINQTGASLSRLKDCRCQHAGTRHVDVSVPLITGTSGVSVPLITGT